MRITHRALLSLVCGTTNTRPGANLRSDVHYKCALPYPQTADSTSTVPVDSTVLKDPEWLLPKSPCWCCSVTQSSLTLCNPRTAACQASLSFTISWSLLKLMPVESTMPSNQPILCRPPLLPPSISPSIRVFSNELFSSGVQSIGATASVLLTNIQSWLPLGLTGWISLPSKGLSSVFSSTTVGKHQFFNAQPSLWSNSHTIHDYWKHHSFDYTDFCRQSDVSSF